MALDDLGLRQARVRSEIPFDVERIEALLRRPEVIADHGNRIVEPQDVAHPRELARCGVVDLRSLPPSTGHIATVAIFMPGTCTSMP